MPTGSDRRQQTRDSLAGMQDMEPVTLRGPGLTKPAPIKYQEGPSASRRIVDALNKFGSSKLQEASQKRQQRSLLEGQMAYHQGRTAEELEMGGDKWALEGYRFMDAQSISSSMLAAQRAQIEQGDYALSPDEFRAQYMSRLDAALEGKDARTANLVREQMAEQMIPLVADHTSMHMRHLEQEGYNSLERSIDIISRDPTATEQLLDFARGDAGGPSSGLSVDRRRAATVSGVIRAFDNDNPMAFSVLSREGILGASLTSEERNSIRAAQQRFENRRRSEYDRSFFDAEQALMRRVEAGELDPSRAVEEQAALYADYGINMTRQEAGVIYDQSSTTSRQADLTRGYLIEEAGLRGDLDRQADIIMDSLVVTESGGNASAFRTNADGRSFGGLVQMGEARLLDYARANGTTPLSVSQYTSMSKREQKIIARWHFKDLIKQANATGAIGSTINGATVTLSGLVAVAHIGGGPGMRKFVKSNGAYNPSDEEGTSLTDYLKTHASGERTEIMSAGERMNRAQNALTQTRARLALETYEYVAPRLADADSMFENGEISREEWRQRRADLYTTYGQERTKADVNHEISMIERVDRQSAEANRRIQDEQYQLAVQAAEASLAPDRIEWETVVQDPASTPEQVRQANRRYIEARNDAHDTYGVSLIDRDNGGASEEIIRATSEAMVRHRKYAEDGVEINAAVNGGYLDRLPKPLQKRAFEEQTQRIVQTYTDEVAEGRMSEADANAAIATDLNTFYADSGMVDPQVRMRMSGTMQGEFVDSEGKPNPAIVDAIQQYAAVKAMNPRAANSMLDTDGRIRAESVLGRTGGNPNLIGESVRNIGIEDKNSPLVQDTDEFLARPDVQKKREQAVSDYLDSQHTNIFERIFGGNSRWDMTGAQREAISSPETEELIRGEITEELARLQRQRPGTKVSDLAHQAGDIVARRTAIIGGEVIVMDPGSDIGEAFFGSRASDYQIDGVENTVVMEYLRSEEFAEAYPEATQVEWAEYLPEITQGRLDKIAGLFGADFDPAMSSAEAAETLRSGVRPFTTFRTPGNGIAVQVLLPDGNYSDPYVIPMRKAGQMYIDKRRRKITE